MGDRWATFDCYGTLVDWNAGIGGELERLFGVESADVLLARYHELEREVQLSEPSASYRDVLTISLIRLAGDAGLAVPEGETNALARSLPSWPVFPDVRPSLEEARERGWRLGILSNTDRDLIDASMEEIGVPFDVAVVASEISSYKPGLRHWEAFRTTTGAESLRHVHVAQSLFHDIEPARRLGIPSIWINRLRDPDDPRPSLTLPSLEGLAGALDELVPP